MTRVLTQATLPIGRIFQATASPRAVTENDWVLTPRDIKIGEKVAGGSFGEVFIGEYMGSTVAIKTPNKDIPQEMYDKFVVEVELMVGLHHPNIVRFIGACLTIGSSFLVLEYLEKGCLYDFLRTEECANYLTYPKMIKFATDTARGMRYLHSRVKIIQRDLKSRNLLLDYAYNVKICDFGLSRYAGGNEQMTACGTPYWAAPEVILGKAYNEKADVFSFAIVLWEICAREEPYDGRPGIDTAIEVAQNGLRPRIPKSCPGAYRRLMESAWSHDPRDRPNMEQVLERLFEMGKDARAKALNAGASARVVAT
ncbi:Protein kinase, putative [Hondaea fermentalgiana]|uniref:Protein kinase, putative n=1 Tax=Hondaea fermentalgiana TaxID=2315210 RepID=A0A2R5GGH9_9STRA|nr:Protein kinase, putative [Hondaea fermentalgiana]|eukprot:GBG29980.1 Protein kinase, putative [Hondaea fermentalgiana]